MATFLDVGLFSHFSVIFTFLFLFVLIYGFLNMQKIIKLGDGEKGLYALIALAMAFISIMSGVVTTFIAVLTPWFTAFIIFVFFVFFIFKMFTGDDDEFFKNLIQSPGLRWTLIVISILILIAALSSTFGQQLLEDNSATVTSNTIENGGQVNQEGVVVYSADNTASSTGQTVITDVSQPGATATSDFNTNVLATFIHPKMLGLILMLLMGFFSILFLAKNQDPNS